MSQQTFHNKNNNHMNVDAYHAMLNANVPEEDACKVATALSNDSFAIGDSLHQLENSVNELKTGQDAIRSDMKIGQDAIRSDMKIGQDAIRSDMKAGQDAIRTDMKAEVAEASRTNTRTILLGISVAATILGLILGLLIKL